MELIFVIGAGTMGLDIAQTFAQAGYPVTVRDVSEEILTRAKARLESGLEKRVARASLRGRTRMRSFPASHSRRSLHLQRRRRSSLRRLWSVRM